MSKQIFEGTTPKRHCNHVIAFEKDRDFYIKCRCCRKWIRIDFKDPEKALKGHTL